MAVCKTGHKVLFSSQINTREFHVSLLEQTNCNIFFSGLGVHVDDILAARQMKHIVIPDLEDLLDQTKAPHYPYEKTFEEAKNDPCVVLHTSGTTGTAVRLSFPNSMLEKLLLSAVLPANKSMMTETRCLESRLYSHTGSTPSLG